MEVREAMFQVCFSGELPFEWEKKNIDALEANEEMGGRKVPFTQTPGYTKAGNWVQ